jgi:hypothetical protein
MLKKDHEMVQYEHINRILSTMMYVSQKNNQSIIEHIHF